MAVYLQLTDIAAIYGIKPGTARKWAEHDDWRYRGSKPRRYSMADAQRSYNRHKYGRVARHLVSRYGTVKDGA